MDNPLPQPVRGVVLPEIVSCLGIYESLIESFQDILCELGHVISLENLQQRPCELGPFSFSLVPDKPRKKVLFEEVLDPPFLERLPAENLPDFLSRWDRARRVVGVDHQLRQGG